MSLPRWRVSMLMLAALAGCSRVEGLLEVLRSALSLEPGWGVAEPADDPVATGTLTATGMAMDPNGLLFLGGSVAGTVRLARGTTTFTSAGGTDLLVARLDNGNGAPVWVKTAGDHRPQAVTDLAGSKLGRVGVLGTFEGTLALGGIASPMHSHKSGLFVAGLAAADGAGLFSVEVPLPPSSTLDGIAADPVDGHFVVCGTIRSGRHSAIFLRKLDSGSGATIWDATLPLASARRQSCRGVAVDGTGQVAVAGVSNDDVLVAKVAVAGGAPRKAFARVYVGTGAAAAAVARDGKGDLAVAGTFTGTLAFDHRADPTRSVTLASAGAEDVFVVKLAGSSGDPIWATRFGDAGVQRASAVAIGIEGGVGYGPKDVIAVTGESAPAGAGHSEVLYLRLDGDTGGSLSNNVLPRPSAHGARGLRLANGGYILLGTFTGDFPFASIGSPIDHPSSSGVKAFVATFYNFDSEGPPPPPPPPVCAFCNDGNPCTVDACGPETGFVCVHQTAADGSTCGPPPDLCHGQGACRAGVCQSVDAVVCPPDLPCFTHSTCNPTTGACTERAPLSEGQRCNLPCGQPGTCQLGTCQTSVPPFDCHCIDCEQQQVANGLCDPKIGCDNIQTGDADLALCRAVRSCILETACASDDPLDCLCGTSRGSDCASSPNGPCVTQVLAATKTGTDPSQAVTRFYDFAFPAGFATQEIACIHNLCGLTSAPPFVDACPL